MRYSSQVKPISYLKANAAEVLRHLAEQRQPLVITQNGEARAVLQDVASFEETQETLAMLNIPRLAIRMWLPERLGLRPTLLHAFAPGRPETDGRQVIPDNWSALASKNTGRPSLSLTE